MFGDQYGLSVESEADEGTKVTIHIPAIPFNEENRKNLENQNIGRKDENENENERFCGFTNGCDDYGGDDSDAQRGKEGYLL